jgi:hypothetical protein
VAVTAAHNLPKTAPREEAFVSTADGESPPAAYPRQIGMCRLRQFSPGLPPRDGKRPWRWRLTDTLRLARMPPSAGRFAAVGCYGTLKQADEPATTAFCPYNVRPTIAKVR